MQNNRDTFISANITNEQAQLRLNKIINTIDKHYLDSNYPPARENGLEFLTFIKNLLKQDTTPLNILISLDLKLRVKEFHYKDDKDKINRIDPEFMADMKMMLATPIDEPKEKVKPVPATKPESKEPVVNEPVDETYALMKVHRKETEKRLQRKNFNYSEWQDEKSCKLMKHIVLLYAEKDPKEGGMYINILKGDDSDLPTRLSMVFSFAKFRADSKFDRDKVEFHESLLTIFDKFLQEQANKAPALPVTPSPNTKPLPKNPSPDEKPARMTGSLFGSNNGKKFQELKQACRNLAKQGRVDVTAYSQIIKEIQDSSLPKQYQTSLFNILQDRLLAFKSTPETSKLLESINLLKSERKSGFENK